MECEQRELFEYEIALLQGLEGAAGNHGAEVDIRTATKRVAAMRLAETNEMKLPDSQLGAGVNHETGSATYECIWGPPPLRDPCLEGGP